MIHKENDITETSDELSNVKKQLKQGKQTCLVMRMELLRAYEIVLYKTMGVTSPQRFCMYPIWSNDLLVIVCAEA